jgi:amino acid permease
MSPGSPTSPSSPKTWRERTFGKLEAGSMRGSIFTLAGTAIGAGCLSTPVVLNYLGVVLGLAMLFFCAFVTWTSMRTVIRASETTDAY